MTRMKGFKKNRFELDEPVDYDVFFADGHCHTIKATSSRDAQIKSNDLTFFHGHFVGANRSVKQQSENGKKKVKKKET